MSSVLPVTLFPLVTSQPTSASRGNSHNFTFSSSAGIETTQWHSKSAVPGLVSVTSKLLFCISFSFPSRGIKLGYHHGHNGLTEQKCVCFLQSVTARRVGTAWENFPVLIFSPYTLFIHSSC